MMRDLAEWKGSEKREREMEGWRWGMETTVKQDQ